jgi:phage baseplate assembly protein gpV
MSAALFDSISRIARHEASARAIAGIGRVTDIFPSDGALPDHAVTIEMRDSGLILPRVSIAVGAMGFAAIPAVDDLVLVVFAEGDFNAPVVVGRLYHPDQEPPEHAEDEIVLRLPSGAPEPKFDLVVAGKAPSLILKLPGDTEIDVLEEKVLIKAGAMQVSVTGAGGGRVEVAAGGSKLTLKKDGDVTLTAAGKLKLEGSEVEISGSARVKIAGAAVEMN